METTDIHAQLKQKGKFDLLLLENKAYVKITFI